MQARGGSRRALALLIRVALGVTIALQVGTVAAISAIAVWRKRRERPQGFPHETLPDVRLGENALRIFSFGQDLYDAMLAAIDEARETIYLETYIWKSDDVGRAFRERLIRKAEAGIEVYVIFDAFGNLVVPRAFKDFPRSVHALSYRAISRPWHLVDPRRYALDHRKLLVVDGRIGFIGGYNLGSVYATQWRDTHLRIEGPAVAQLAGAFVAFWNQHRPRRERIRRHYARQFNPSIVARDTDALRLSFPIRDMYIAAIDRAERHVFISNAYFIPDRALVDALIEAVGRGVTVQVLVPWESNHPAADWLARGYFTECLRAGVRIFGYKAMIHAKTCTIDGEWSTIGTANLDRLSSVGNYEINLEIYSQAIARQMEALFDQDKTDATELRLDSWEARPWPSKVGERLLVPLRNLM